MCFYEKQTPLQYLHVILFKFFVIFVFYGYTSVDQFLLKDCSKIYIFYRVSSQKEQNAGKALLQSVGEKKGEKQCNVMSIYGRAEQRERERDNQ